MDSNENIQIKYTLATAILPNRLQLEAGAVLAMGLFAELLSGSLAKKIHSFMGKIFIPIKIEIFFIVPQSSTL